MTVSVCVYYGLLALKYSTLFPVVNSVTRLFRIAERREQSRVIEVAFVIEIDSGFALLLRRSVGNVERSLAARP